MKTGGIIRRIDDMGRIVLPVELRRALELEEHEEVEICLDGDRLILKKFSPSCIFCGGCRDLVQFQNRNICQTCLLALRRG